MGTLTSAPRTLRGAIVAVDPVSPISRTVIFQYNPDEFSRTLEPAGRESASEGSGRTWGAPKESLSLTVELDATDQLEAAGPGSVAIGIAPQLATLEMLLHPSSARVITNSALLLAGTIELLPIELPLTVLAWGPGRVLPVKITTLAVTEQAFTPGLSPIRASVEISADVLTYDDVSPTHVAFGLSLAHLVAKEVMASAAAVAGAGRTAAEMVGG
ncbi:hypothetical protein [Pseudactinotalea sp. Z1748]|uniref:hypothetical protein n=1 Tax=Pseudactinotalea sp. Z1748 TaxID=3413027 RepID=UPI003C7E2B38